MKEFKNDENSYLRWIEENPNGYIVNSWNPPTKSYLIIHKATCGSISSTKIGNYTAPDMMKTCSLNLDELEKWAKEKVGGKLNPCKKCFK